jgi:hypothetical protein
MGPLITRATIHSAVIKIWIIIHTEINTSYEKKRADHICF